MTVTRLIAALATLLLVLPACAQQAPDLCIDGGFETAGGWELLLQQGAEGTL